MILRPFEYIGCTTAEEAVSQLVEHGDDAFVISGGTVVVPMMKHRIVQPAVLVSLVEIDELNGVRVEDGQLRIGALATHQLVSRSSLVREHAPLLATACGRVASPVIRSMGTIGGNVAYAESASDPPSALLALDATITMHGPEGRRSVPIREFYVGFYETVRGPEEIIIDIAVPLVSEPAEYEYLKWTPRAREDKPLVGLAVSLRRDGDQCVDLQVGLSGVCETPVLLREGPAALIGRTLDQQTIRDAAAAAAGEVEPFDDLQASADYRRDMVEVWFRRVMESMARRTS